MCAKINNEAERLKMQKNALVIPICFFVFFFFIFCANSNEAITRVHSQYKRMTGILMWKSAL